jgi:predicted RNase H-like HicB family nuclease
MASVAPAWLELEPRVYRCEVRLRPEEDGGFSVYAASLPGAVSQGEDEQEALANITEALEGVIATYLETGLPIPWSSQPRPLEIGETRLWVEVHA